MSKFSYEISNCYQFQFSPWNSVQRIQLPVQSMEFSYQFSPWNSVASSVHGIQLPVQSMEFSYQFSPISLCPDFSYQSY